MCLHVLCSILGGLIDSECSLCSRFGPLGAFPLFVMSLERKFGLESFYGSIASYLQLRTAVLTCSCSSHVSFIMEATTITVDEPRGECKHSEQNLSR